jgi:hypothetical protein
MIHTTLADSDGHQPAPTPRTRVPRRWPHDPPIAPGTPPLQAGQETTVSTRAAIPVTMTHDHHARAVASGLLPLRWLEPFLSAAGQAVAA